jgi:Tfp pilus assembly protein PilO
MKKENFEQEKEKSNIKITDYALPVVVFSFIILSAVFFIKPKIENLFSFQKQIEKSQEKLAKVTAKVDYLQKYSQIDLENKTNQLIKALPTEKDVSGLVFSLKTLSEELNLEITSLSLDPGELATDSAEKQKKENENLMEVSLAVLGSGEKIYEYMDKIESTAPISKIIKHSILEEDGLAEAKISLEAYFLPIPQNLGKIEDFNKITSEEEKTWERVKTLKILESSDSFPIIDSGKTNPFSF